MKAVGDEKYRTSNQLDLWDVDQLEKPVHSFLGHQALITEFCWRNP